MHPEQGHKNDPRDGILPLRGQAERSGAVLPEEKAPGKPDSCFSYLKRGCKKEGVRLFRGVCYDRTRKNGLKLKRREI